MKRTGIILIIVLALAGGALWFFSQPRGVSVAGVDLGGSERAWMADRTKDFLEDLQFKDFEKAATYHLPEKQQKRDIPKLIQRAFRIRHEVLDIVGYDVVEVDLDRSKTRARVRTNVHFHVLGPERVRDDKKSTQTVELLLYWFRGENGKWTMDLESSL